MLSISQSLFSIYLCPQSDHVNQLQFYFFLNLIQYFNFFLLKREREAIERDRERETERERERESGNRKRQGEREREREEREREREKERERESSKLGTRMLPPSDLDATL